MSDWIEEAFKEMQEATKMKPVPFGTGGATRENNVSDAVNEFVITESGITITVTVTVSDEGAKPSDRSRCEWYGEDMANKMFIKAAKKHSPRRVRFTKIHERD